MTGTVPRPLYPIPDLTLTTFGVCSIVILLLQTWKPSLKGNKLSHTDDKFGCRDPNLYVLDSKARTETSLL